MKVTTMKSKINNHAGYTLIELLTVVTIIGILASIAIPNYRGYRAKAQMVTVYATMHQIMLAQEVYWTDFETFFPGDGTQLEGQDGAAIPINGTDLSIMIPNGQTWIIKSDDPLKNYTVDITTNFDRDQNGDNDTYFYYRTGRTVTTDIPNLR